MRLAISKLDVKRNLARKMRPVDLDIKETGAVCILKLKGRLTSGEAVSQLENAFHRTLASGHNCVVLDLEAVSFVDSSGIGSVVNILRQTNKVGGTVKLVNPSNFVAKTFKMVGILSLFSIHLSEQDAIGPS